MKFQIFVKYMYQIIKINTKFYNIGGFIENFECKCEKDIIFVN